MNIIRGIHHFPKSFQNGAVTIGNFDGVHLGHQEIFKCLKKKSIQYQIPSVVVTFEPSPEEFFFLKQSLPLAHVPARLTNFREKILRLHKTEMEQILICPFNEKLASLTTSQFIKTILVDGLKCRYLIVGEDFRFGKDRKGEIADLKQASEQYHFDFEAISTQTIIHKDYSEKKIGSTLIRDSLSKADFDLAHQLLGYPYQIVGKVIHGEGRGKLLGFSTANINLKRLISPLKGTYLVKVYGLDTIYLGIANIGYRPTFHPISQLLLEVHLLDFEGDLYGKQISVEFLKKIREEKQFDSEKMLKEQISKDVNLARELLQ